jgi:two-component system, NarL family, sensor kinase
MATENHDIFFMIIGGTIVLVLLLCFIVSFLFVYKARQERHKREMQEIKKQYDQEILKTELEIKEQTLKNISEEIHDNVGQVLSLAVLNLSALEFKDAEKASQKVDNITRLVEKAVADLRNLSKTMDASNIAQVGLAAIIQFELEMLEKTGMYKTTFTLSGAEKRLTGSREIVIYRIVQESLNNVMKHAQATSVEVAIVFSETHLVIDMADNGRGFDITNTNKGTIRGNGAGIKNMTSRAALIGGELTVKSVPSSGTRVILTVPYTTATIHH